MIYTVILGAFAFASLCINVYFYFQLQKTPTPEDAPKSQSAEELLSELLNNKAVNLQVYPASDYFLRSPRQ